MHFLTTRQCADVLNDALDMKGVFKDYFIRGEIADGRLVARVQDVRRGRLWIRVHPKDLVAYCEAHYPRIVSKVEEAMNIAQAS